MGPPPGLKSASNWIELNWFIYPNWDLLSFVSSGCDYIEFNWIIHWITQLQSNSNCALLFSAVTVNNPFLRHKRSIYPRRITIAIYFILCNCFPCRPTTPPNFYIIPQNILLYRPFFFRAVYLFCRTTYCLPILCRVELFIKLNYWITQL